MTYYLILIDGRERQIEVGRWIMCIYGKLASFRVSSVQCQVGFGKVLKITSECLQRKSRLELTLVSPWSYTVIFWFEKDVMVDQLRLGDSMTMKGSILEDSGTGCYLFRAQSFLRFQCFSFKCCKICFFYSSSFRDNSSCCLWSCLTFVQRLRARGWQFVYWFITSFLLSRLRIPTATRTLRASQTLLFRLRLFFTFCSEDSVSVELFLERRMLARSLYDADFLTLRISLISSESSFSPTSLFCNSPLLTPSLFSSTCLSSFFTPLLNSGVLNVELSENPISPYFSPSQSLCSTF